MLDDNALDLSEYRGENPRSDTSTNCQRGERFYFRLALPAVQALRKGYSWINWQPGDMRFCLVSHMRFRILTS